MKVIISIPAYNEENTLGPVLKELKHAMGATKYDYEILVLNDGSVDKTVEVAKSNGAIVYSNSRNLGLAETFKHEMRRCIQHKADIIVHTDADGQYPAAYIPSMIRMIEDGNDLVLGSRFGKGHYSGSRMKNLGNTVFAKVFSSLLKLPLTDTTTGFRAFTREVAELPLINSFTYTQEQLIRAGKAKMKIAELPITTRKTRESRLFKNPFIYAIRAWINILRIYRDFEPLIFFGRVGLSLVGLSVAIGIYLMIMLYLQGLHVLDNLIPTILLAVILFSTGLQVLLFGFLADMNQK